MINTDKLAAAIYTGAVDENNLPLPVYKHNADELIAGVEKGFKKAVKGLEYNTPDRETLAALKNNIYRFSAAKTFQQTSEMVNALDLMSKALTEGERIVSFKDFKEVVKGISGRYNVDYLRTEYTTAIASAQSASAWARFESEKETLPNLRYSTIGDACPICAPLDGVTLPITDPFWDSNNVPQHFNCLCILEQEDEDFKVTSNAKRDELAANLEGLKSEVFNNNVGKSKEIFNEAHPYFSAPRELVENNFGLPIPEGAQEIPVEVGFVPAKTIKEAEAYALNELGCEYADFKGLDLALANDANRGLYETKLMLPEFKMKGIGTIQNVNTAIKKDLYNAYVSSDLYKTYVSNYGKAMAERFATSAVKRYAGANRAEAGVVALSQVRDIKKIAGVEVDLRKYTGVFINNSAKVTQLQMNATVKDCIDRGWFAKYAPDFSSIMNHELGHEIDKLLGIRKNPDFIAIFNREHAQGLDYVSNRLSRYGATAGKIIDHRPHEMIAECWAEFTTAETPRELAREVGTLMLKEYYEKYLQGTGTTFKTFFEKTTKVKSL